MLADCKKDYILPLLQENRGIRFIKLYGTEEDENINNIDTTGGPTGVDQKF